MRAASVLKLVLINIVVFLFMVASLEAALYATYIAKLPFYGVQRAARDFYRDHERVILQYLPKCSKYDHELTYVLRPGTCHFKNREFDTTLHINSHGFHDLEEDLDSPEIIVMGDSQAFGWGVEDSENFAALLQQKTERKILNMAVPSYGTVRELLSIKKSAPPSAHTIIIQYSDNDFRENLAYKSAHNIFKPSSERDYNFYASVIKHTHTKYFRFKFLRYFMPTLARDIFAGKKNLSEKEAQHHAHREAKLFMTILTNSGLDLTRYKFIVLPLNGYNSNDSYFTTELEHYLKTLRGRQEVVPDLTVVDLSSKLKDEHYYYYDDHINAAGHKVVAEVLAELFGAPAAEN